MWPLKPSIIVQCLLLFSIFQVPALAIKKVRVFTVKIFANFFGSLSSFMSLTLFLFFLMKKKNQSYIVYLGSHAHGSKVSEADLDRVADSHYDFLGSFLGRYALAVIFLWEGMHQLLFFYTCPLFCFKFFSQICYLFQQREGKRFNILLIQKAYQWLCCQPRRGRSS